MSISRLILFLLFVNLMSFFLLGCRDKTSVPPKETLKNTQASTPVLSKSLAPLDQKKTDCLWSDQDLETIKLIGVILSAKEKRAFIKSLEGAILVVHEGEDLGEPCARLTEITESQVVFKVNDQRVIISMNSGE